MMGTNAGKEAKSISLWIPSNEQEQSQVKERADAVQDVTQNSVEAAFVDPGYTGDSPRDQAKKGFVLLPGRWVVERRFAWTSRFRRLARDCERLPETFAILLLKAFVKTIPHVL